ncbi:MAG: ACP S-malonyltransferase [Alphaproteobacteria bacterium]|nr:ACP S-malonyltransferase [Alphaproteobacteria bacterium]
MTTAFVFPGQGSQAVGMGKELAEALPEARAVFEEVDDALGLKLSAIMWEGPADILTLTENAQPALMAVSVAVARVIANGGYALSDKVAFVAGHSLGEYSALTATGALTLADSARLLRRRGQAMQRAVPVGDGAMAALLGADFDLAEEIASAAAGDGVCQVANDNGGGQLVISGSRAAVDRAIEISKERGVKRAMQLPVSAPFHCTLMQPAADEMAEALADVAIAEPIIPVVANVTAAAVSDPEMSRALLVEQVTKMVRWRESVLFMRDQGVDKLVELGTGKVLAGLTKRIDRDIKSVSVSGPHDIDEFFKAL